MGTRSSFLAWKIPWTGEPGYRPWGHKESDIERARACACTRARTHTHTHIEGSYEFACALGADKGRFLCFSSQIIKGIGLSFQHVPLEILVGPVSAFDH